MRGRVSGTSSFPLMSLGLIFLGFEFFLLFSLWHIINAPFRVSMCDMRGNYNFAKERCGMKNNTELKLSLDDMDFSVCTYNCLKRAGINTLQDLSKCTTSDLMRVRNLNQRCFREIVDKCNEYGVCIVDDTEGQ